jgi:hypothetical protein
MGVELATEVLGAATIGAVFILLVATFVGWMGGGAARKKICYLA